MVARLGGGWQITCQYRTQEGGVRNVLRDFPNIRTAEKEYNRLINSAGQVVKVTLWSYKRPVKRWEAPPFDDPIPF